LSFAGELKSVFSNNRDHRHNFTFSKELASPTGTAGAGLSAQRFTHEANVPVNML
tara:strand:- start:287 stop:451 length:165 start_codon:yes stop_codon:yes gene_type:complete